MLTITRSFAHQARIIIARALFGSGRPDATLPVQFTADSETLRLRAQAGSEAVEYRVADAQPAAELTVPLSLLADCDGRQADPVQLERRDGQVLARWQDGPVPQVATCDMPDFLPGFPEPPTEFGENPPALLSALVHAVETADPEPGRFALNKVQLRGRSGLLAATDGRHLWSHSGFVFPWDGDVLLPKTPLFACKELPQDQAVLVGQRNEQLCVRVGPWTFWLAVDTSGRFPKVDDMLQPVEAATATLRIADTDADFLLKSLRRLPAAVTVDLNGQVAVRAQLADRGQVTELVLNGSTYSGEALRIHTDRRYLNRALALGFRELQVFGPGQPLLCRQTDQTYVWAPLSPESAVPPADNAIRIESHQSPNKPAPRIREPARARTTMPDRNVNRRHATSQVVPHAATEPSSNGSDVIETAEALRRSLRESLDRTSELLHALKQQRKRSRLVASTLASLRQLDTVAD